MRGQWVEVNPDNIKRAMRYFDQRKRGITLAETLRVASHGADDDIGLAVAGVDTKGHLRAVLERLRGGRQI